MSKLFIEDLQFEGKKVLIRVDFNVPLDNDLNVVDAGRIQAVLPTIRYCLDKGGSVILMSHLGRPEHVFCSEMSLAPCAKVLEVMIGKKVIMASDCVGDEVQQLVKNLKKGDILLLENLRFHRAEEYPDEDGAFAKELASFGDLYINDAFASAHREHSSTYTITKYFPRSAAAGYLLASEAKFLDEALKSPQRPFYGIIGGSKISTKIGVLRSLLEKVDALLIGGAMCYTFLKAKGAQIGHSLHEKDFVPIARALLDIHEKKILLPVDVVAAPQCSNDSPSQVVTIAAGIPPELEGLDIGPQTVELFSKKLQGAKTVLWNGPMGVFEMAAFAQGTRALARALTQTSAYSLVAGGDSLAAIKDAGVADKISHLATGGGATLEYIEKGTLPAIEALTEKAQATV